MSIRRLKPFKSSNVKSATYDPASREMDVTFKDGETYDYAGVPMRRFNSFDSAPSKGKFMHTKVIPNYKATKEK